MPVAEATTVLHLDWEEEEGGKGESGKEASPRPRNKGGGAGRGGSSGVSGCVRHRSDGAGLGGAGRPRSGWAAAAGASRRFPEVRAPAGSSRFVVGGSFCLVGFFSGASDWLSPYCQLAGVRKSAWRSKKRENIQSARHGGERRERGKRRVPRAPACRSPGAGGLRGAVLGKRPPARGRKEPGLALEGTGKTGYANFLKTCL
ncbi:uncharacterized protein [Aphelocoma coerulescens]|uniref:uncharacterized protein n=1 Tax=Aphelocoma coerulescens TaxID=39617 RepID=UPI003604523A